jgi:hypothetical protein
MASLLLQPPAEATSPDPAPPAPAATRDELLLVAGSQDPVLLDFVAFASHHGARSITVLAPPRVCRRVAAPVECVELDGISRTTLVARRQGWRCASVVVFLGPGLGRTDRAVVDAAAEWAAARSSERVILVSTFRVHIGDRRAAAAEAHALARFRRPGATVSVFRPAAVLSSHSRTRAVLRAFGFCYPLVPRRRTGCCVNGAELFAALAQELSRPNPRGSATYTLLGPNRPWRDRLREHCPSGFWQRSLTLATTLLAWLCLGSLGGLVLDLAARWLPRLRLWNFDTLYPDCPRELLALYNRYNFRHVKIVGYNNGVVHFGQKFPGRTVVSTVRCDQVARLVGDRATFDAGVTLRRAIDVVTRGGKQFHVLPNYSYVSVGTAFFVPIHGSASDSSMLGDAIERVLLYDPVGDRFLTARRADPAFRQHLYNPTSQVLLLRLRFRLRDGVHYRMQKTRLEHPTSQDVLGLLRDGGAANVEIRKPRANRPAIDVYCYFVETEGAADALELPRDSLGRLWDRLEENPLTSFVFHALTRHFAYHVELFFTAEEFAIFWDTHGSLPLAKIQLRYLRQDRFPHSPCAQHDCVAVDLFMLRKYRQAFDSYIKENFRAVQFNSGKHSL